MRKKYLNLLKSLSEDKNFVSDFDMAESIEEKYDLVKSRFQNLPKDDFMEFMLEIQLEQSKLSEEELSQVSGGINKKSLATIAMLSAALGSMSSMNVANATGVEFVVGDDARLRGSERITGKALNDEGFKDNLLSLANEINGEIQTNLENYSFECRFPKLSRNFNVRITPECVQHIILGDWYISDDGVRLGMILSLKEPQICGGHTTLSKQLLQDFNQRRGVPVECFEKKGSMFNEVVSDASPNSVQNLSKIIREVCSNPKAKFERSYRIYRITGESETAGCNVVVAFKPEDGEVVMAHPLNEETASEESGPNLDLRGLVDVRIIEDSNFLDDQKLKKYLAYHRRRIHQVMTDDNLKEFFSIKVTNSSIGGKVPEIFISEFCVQNIVVGDWLVKVGQPHVLPKTITSDISGLKELVGGHTYKAFRLLGLFNTQKGLSGDNCITLHSAFPKDVVKDESPNSLENLSNIINEVVNSSGATVEERDDKFFVTNYSPMARSEVVVVINKDGEVFTAFPNVPGIPKDFILPSGNMSLETASEAGESKTNILEKTSPQEEILKENIRRICNKIYSYVNQCEFKPIKVGNLFIGNNIHAISISKSCIQKIVVGNWSSKEKFFPKTSSNHKVLVGGYTKRAFELLKEFNTIKGLSENDCITLSSAFPQDVVKDESERSLGNLYNIINEVVNNPEATVEERDDKFFVCSDSKTARSEVIVVIKRDGKVFDVFPNVPGIPEDFISTEETVSTVESSDKSETKPGSTSITNVSKTKNNNGNQKFKVEHSDKSKKMLGITMLQKTESEASKSITNNISEKISSRETASKAGESITNVSKPKNTNDNQKFKVERSKKGMLNIFKPVEPAKPESEKER